MYSGFRAFLLPAAGEHKVDESAVASLKTKTMIQRILKGSVELNRTRVVFLYVSIITSNSFLSTQLF